MVLLALVYAAKGYREVSRSGTQFGPLTIGMSAGQIQSAMASERQTSSTPTTQVFQRDGRTITLALDGQAKLAGIICTEQGAAPLACPAVLGVRVGDHPDRVKALLGPGDQKTADGKAVLSYPSIGIHLQLADNQVVSIDLRPAGTEQPGIWPIILWRLFP